MFHEWCYDAEWGVVAGVGEGRGGWDSFISDSHGCPWLLLMGAHDVGKARSPYTALREVEESQKKEGEMMFTDRRCSRIISSNRSYFCCESVLFCFLNFCFFFYWSKAIANQQNCWLSQTWLHTSRNRSRPQHLHRPPQQLECQTWARPRTSISGGTCLRPLWWSQGSYTRRATPLPWCPPTPPAPSPSESYVIFQGVMIPSLSIDIGPVDI